MGVNGADREESTTNRETEARDQKETDVNSDLCNEHCWGCLIEKSPTRNPSDAERPAVCYIVSIYSGGLWGHDIGIIPFVFHVNCIQQSSEMKTF